ncbi:MAG: class B sortase [Hydrogenoanaerobacterium sp.]
MINRRRIICTVFLLSVLAALAACGKKQETASSQSEVPLVVSDYPFYNPLTEPSNIADDNTPTPPDEEIVTKIAEYEEKNPETIAWLKIPGTKIDDIVFKDPKGNNKYMRLDNNGKWAMEGCYFADYRVNIKDRATLGKNTIIYGHNLNDNTESGLRFSQLINYVNLDYAKAHPYVYVTTPEDEMVFKVFATFYANWREFDYIKTDFKTPAEFTDLVAEARKRSLANFDVDVTGGDKIVTLSTCTYKFGGVKNKNQRFVVMARLLHTTESVTDAVTAVANPAPVMPKF